MNYPDGETIRIGDLVWFNEGTSVACISDVIQTEADMREWGVGEKGIFFCFDLSGNTFTNDVYNSENMLADEGIGLLNETEKNSIRNLHATIVEHEAVVLNINAIELGGVLCLLNQEEMLQFLTSSQGYWVMVTDIRN